MPWTHPRIHACKRNAWTAGFEQVIQAVNAHLSNTNSNGVLPHHLPWHALGVASASSSSAMGVSHGGRSVASLSTAGSTVGCCTHGGLYQDKQCKYRRAEHRQQV